MITQVHYLRPSFGLHDLDLWKDGLCGMNNNVHASSAMSAPTVTAEEAAAMQRDLASRYAVLRSFRLYSYYLLAMVTTSFAYTDCWYWGCS